MINENLNPIFKDEVTTIFNDCVSFGLNGVFVIFKNILNFHAIIYPCFSNELVYYNLDEDKLIGKYKVPQKYMRLLKHFLDKDKNRDLLISLSSSNNNLIVWDISSFKKILTVKNIYQFGSTLYYSCFIYNENKIAILTCCCDEPNEIKILELDGKISTFPNTNISTTFIENFKDLNSNLTYVVTCHKRFMRSYIYNTKALYKQYEENGNNTIDDKTSFREILIYNDVELKLISSDDNGFIKVWNFHSGQLLKKISCLMKKCISLTLWNSRYLICSIINDFIEIIDLRENKIISIISKFKCLGVSIVAVKLADYGNCLIGQYYNKINLIHC